MDKTIVKSIRYEKGDNIQIQGKRSEIDEYLKKGYYIKEERNGNWVLVKAVKLNVTLRNGNNTKTFNMKQDVCDYYNRERISRSLADKFKRDIESGKIIIKLYPEGYYRIN